jgi:hypothetical protein
MKKLTAHEIENIRLMSMAGILYDLESCITIFKQDGNSEEFKKRIERSSETLYLKLLLGDSFEDLRKLQLP